MLTKTLPTLALCCGLLASCGAAPPDTGLLPSARWAHPHEHASSRFSAAWRDGLAEVAAYRGTAMRYGAPRDAEAVLIFVTEPLDRRTLVKDDDAPASERLDVLKLNFALRFQTGIYPYSVLTSVFAPTDVFDGERFSPAKISFGEQDWCGGTSATVWPDDDALVERSSSYFASEGDVSARADLPRGTLYEDALYIQLRELDGPFADGGDWEGSIVQSLWHARRDHHPIAAEHASITREDLEDRTRFTLRAEGGYERTFDVARDDAHTLLAFRSTDGDDFRLAGHERLAYWELHDPGEESYRAAIGLSRGLEILTPRDAAAPTSIEAPP